MKKLLAISRRVRWLIRALLCLAAAMGLSLALLGKDPVRPARLEDLPDRDEALDVKALMDEGRLDEAEALLRIAAARPGHAVSAELLEAEAELERKRRDWGPRAGRVLSGFVTGRGDSVEALSGAVGSDMLLYGDVRDLAEQGYKRLAGQETDPLIAALAGAGLLTEAADAIDWAPGVLKHFRRTGALTPSFSRWLLDAARRSARNRALDPGLGRVLGDTGRMTRRMGVQRSSVLFRHIERPGDLAAAARMADLDPDTAYLLIHHGGSGGFDLLRRGVADPAFPDLARRAVRKGPAGLDWLRRSSRLDSGLGGVRRGARIMKTIRQGRAAALLRALARHSAALRMTFWGTALAALAASAFCFQRALHPGLLRRRKVPA